MVPSGYLSAQVRARDRDVRSPFQAGHEGSIPFARSKCNGRVRALPGCGAGPRLPLRLRSLRLTKTTGARCLRSQPSWRACVLRGDIHEFRLPRGTGREQRGRRHGVIVQANELLPRSVILVAPASRSARPASFRPEIALLGETTRVLVEQVGAIDAGRLGDLVGRVTPEQQWGIDEALTTVLGLR